MLGRNGCIFYFYFYIFNLFLADLGLCCCAPALLSCGERGPLLAAELKPLTAVASPVEEHGLQALASVVVAHGL